MAAVVLTSTEGLTHSDWLEYRRKGIGGSDVSVICGVNKYRTPIELWMDKTGQLPYQEAGEAAYWGSTLESVVRDEFVKRTGLKVIQINQILQSKEYPYMLANLDGVIMCPTHGRCIFEAKTASAYKADEWDNDTVPYGYILQIQHYLFVTGYSGAYVAVLIGGNSFHWRFVQRDEEIISMLVKMEGDFWQRVTDDVPPPADGSEACTAFLSQRFPKSTAASRIELPADAAALIREYNEAGILLDDATERKRKAGNQLKQLLGTNESGTVGGNIVSWKDVKQERFDSKALQSEQPTIYSKYLNQSTHRRFVVKRAG